MKKLVNSIIVFLIFLIIFVDILRESESLERKINGQLRKWDRTKTIAFLRSYFHRLPLQNSLDPKKSGGTSIDESLKPIIEKLSAKEIDQYLGFSHFDWSFFQTLPYNNSLEPIMMLREPMARSVSHFHFKKTMFEITSKRENQKFLKMSIEEFFNDPFEMMRFNEIWMDTFSSVAWLTGMITNADDYTFTRENFPTELERKRSFEDLELKRLNASWSLNLAADRLESLGWFGILERMEESELLLS